ncbi:MAG TPA: hypothetical protein IAA51_10570 [Candidatus Cottocaccamicrobium excrementipullorum]|nr:hypothetical protein [Candidatus Cottocaccamicrobium excrementipullorum]
MADVMHMIDASFVFPMNAQENMDVKCIVTSDTGQFNKNLVIEQGCRRNGNCKKNAMVFSKGERYTCL